MEFRALFILVLSFIIFQPNAYMQKKKETVKKDVLTGKWETANNPLEASRLTLEFKAKNMFSYTLTSDWHGTYILDGTKLVSSIYIPIYKKYKTDTTTVLIFSDTLIQVGKDKGVETTTRMIREVESTNTGAGLVGSWRIENEDAESSVITYNSNGTYNVKNILKSFSGSYNTKSDTLMTFSNGHMMFKNRFVIDKGVLRLYSKTQSGPITLMKAEK
jgi:hypothetical protein